MWAFLCPNPLCDTELVVFPDHSGERVRCPSCGFEFMAPRVVPLQIASPDDVARPPERAFARGAAIARPAAPSGAPKPSLSPSSPPPTGAPTPGTTQAAAALSALARGMPVAPAASPPSEAAGPPRPPL
ncbi:MAG: hypothetical protein AMK72_10935, partial [Planctomycetes bacterium SM23_25]